MARWTGTTTQRGYGAQHQNLRRQLVAAFQPGQPCARCGQPIWDVSQTDLGHTDDRAAYTGLEHRSCNRADGARRKNRRQRLRDSLTVPMPSRRWLCRNPTNHLSRARKIRTDRPNIDGHSNKTLMVSTQQASVRTREGHREVVRKVALTCE